jgi:hypothetical protein
MDSPFSAELLRQLAVVDEQISRSERNIARQRKRVDTIEQASGDAGFSLILLQTFQQCLALRHQHRRRILDELGSAVRYSRPS